METICHYYVELVDTVFRGEGWLNTKAFKGIVQKLWGIVRRNRLGFVAQTLTMQTRSNSL